MVDDLMQGMDRGRGYAQSLQRALNQPRAGHSRRNAPGNRTRSSEDIREVQRLQGQADRYHELLVPSQAENLRFFTRYQVGWMYLRYFMWNFSGRQNDVQGHGDFIDGNWVSGVDFIDAERLGSRDHVPPRAAGQGHNRFYLFPLARPHRPGVPGHPWLEGLHRDRVAVRADRFCNRGVPEPVSPAASGAGLCLRRIVLCVCHLDWPRGLCPLRHGGSPQGPGLGDGHGRTVGFRRGALVRRRVHVWRRPCPQFRCLLPRWTVCRADWIGLWIGPKWE